MVNTNNIYNIENEILKHTKRRAFTLVEVLITIGVIGIVAAMTIPTLMQKYNERETVVKLKRAYSVIDNAYRLAQEEWGQGIRNDLDWSKTETRRVFLDKMLPYLNVSIDCAKADSTACFSRQGGKGDRGAYYTQLVPNKGYSNLGGNKNSTVILADGTMLMIGGSPHASAKAVSIMIDVNGRNKPNQYGYDSFWFNIENYGGEKILPNNANRYSFSRNTCKLSATDQATGCAWWVLKNNNLDYLRCDLDWNTQTRCPKK